MTDEPSRSGAAGVLPSGLLCVSCITMVQCYAEFVLLGGLVPDLLCTRSGMRHAGTTDVDVQVDLEIAAGAVNTVRLERALVNAEFKADPSRVWRWETEADGHNVVAKFELLADLDGEPAGAVVHFDECDVLGAVNVRGTGFAARDYSSLTLQSRIGGVDYEVGVNIPALPASPSQKQRRLAAVARRRTGTKSPSFYCTILRRSGVRRGASQVSTSDTTWSGRCGPLSTTFSPNFDSPDGHGPRAYASQVLVDHPGADDAQLRADAVLRPRADQTTVVVRELRR